MSARLLQAASLLLAAVPASPRWWEQLNSGMERLGQESRKDLDLLSGWAGRVEQEMAPALDKFSAQVGGLVTDLVDALEESPLLEPALVSRADGSPVLSGEHSMDRLGQLSLPGLLGQLARVGKPAQQSFDPFSFFGLARRNWWEGEHVCTSRDLLEEGVGTEENGFRLNMQLSQCREGENSHECSTIITENGITKTVVQRHFCCHGYKRQDGKKGCTKLDMKPLLETIKDLGGFEFLGLLEKYRMKTLNNMTVFAPTNDAIEDFHRDIVALNSIYSGDDGGLTSKKHGVDEAPDMENILATHLTPGFLSADR